MDNLELINKFQLAIIDIYLQEDIQCLGGIDNENFIKDKELILCLFDVIGEHHSTRDCIKMLDEFRSCSDDIMYFTAQLYLYKPFMNNPLNEKVLMSADKYLYPNNQNLPSKRYFTCVNILFEKLYNYWDRIGDLIETFLPELNIKSNQITFALIMDRIPIEYQSIEAYIWLKKFKENEYKEMNNKRIQVVHYISPNTLDSSNHLFIATERNEIEKWVNQRYERAEYFKNHINLTIEGLYQTLILLEEIGNKKEIENVE